jgi:hypothetical protein
MQKFTPHVVSAMLIVVGVIHLLPLIGVLGGAQLTSLYGVSFDEPNTLILMRHRAVLFGLLGVFLIFAAFRQQLQVVAFVAGTVSIVSFLMIAGAADGYNAQLARVVVADWVALGCLVCGVVAYRLGQRGQSPR